MDQQIRIGTIVNGGPNTVNYMDQIIPHGFESFTVMFWESLNGTDLKKLAQDVKARLEGTGIVISSLGMFGNPLEHDAKAQETREGFAKCIEAAQWFGCDIVGGFAGRLRGIPLDQSMGRYKEVFAPLAKQAEDAGVRIAFENCDMGGRWESGDWNIAQTPICWEMMFNEVPSDNIGLEWEPCHQMVKLIDPIPQLRKWINKVFHVHGKDATVLWDVVREHGVYGSHTFAYHRTPGFGDSNWTDIISILRQGGFKGAIDIEGWHDPVYRDDLEMTGQVHGLNFLKNARGGSYVPNPK